MHPLEPAWWEPWDVVAADVHDDVRADAWEIHQAERVQVTLVDRISRGTQLFLVDGQLIDVAAVVERLHGGAVIVGGGREGLVLAHGIVEVIGLPAVLPGDLPAYATIGSWLRRHLGDPIKIDGPGQIPVRGILGLSAKDHVDVHVEDGRVRTLALGRISCVWLTLPLSSAHALA